MLEDCWRILVSSIFEFLTPSAGNERKIRVQYRGRGIFEVLADNGEKKFSKYNELAVSGCGRKNFLNFLVIFNKAKLVKKIICPV